MYKENAKWSSWETNYNKYLEDKDWGIYGLPGPKRIEEKDRDCLGLELY